MQTIVGIRLICTCRPYQVLDYYADHIRYYTNMQTKPGIRLICRPYQVLDFCIQNIIVKLK